MSHVRSKGSSAELLVRQIAHRLGFRFRLHRRDMPGTPDLVFPRRRKVIFVNGCFWHRHRCRKGRSMPETRRDFWEAKFTANLRRDRAARRRLQAGGWQVLTIWECEVAARNMEELTDLICSFLGPL